MNGVTLLIHSIIGCVFLYCDSKHKSSKEADEASTYLKCSVCLSCIGFLLAIIIMICAGAVNSDVTIAKWVVYANDGQYIIYDSGFQFTELNMDFDGNEVDVDCELTYYDKDGEEIGRYENGRLATDVKVLVRLKVDGAHSWKEYEIDNGECIDVAYSVFNRLCFGICAMDE